VSRSDRISRVSSRLSSSSTLTTTTTGTPLRVTITRSCCLLTRSTISENRSLTAASESVSAMARIIANGELDEYGFRDLP